MGDPPSGVCVEVCVGVCVGVCGCKVTTRALSPDGEFLMCLSV